MTAQIKRCCELARGTNGKKGCKTITDKTRTGCTTVSINTAVLNK